MEKKLNRLTETEIKVAHATNTLLDREKTSPGSKEHLLAIDRMASLIANDSDARDLLERIQNQG